MARYVLGKDGHFYSKLTGERMLSAWSDEVARPIYMPDIPHYISPVTEKPITSRSERREDLKRSGCIEAGDRPRLNNGMTRSEKFARKHQLKWEGHQ